MLPSPTPRSQNQQRRRLTINLDQPILEARHDPRRRISRPNTPLTACHPRSTVQRPTQHRRQLSVPDDVMMSIAGASNGGMEANMSMFQFKTTNPFGDAAQTRMKQEAAGQFNMVQQHHANQSQQQSHAQHLRPKTPPQLLKQFQPITPRSPFADLQAHPQEERNASQLIDDLLDFNPQSFSQSSSDSFMSTESFPMENIQRSFSYPQTHSNLPSPPHTNQLRSVSTFDLAPLPHPNFINMAALSMPVEDIESDQESFHSAQAELKPTFPPAPKPSQPTRQFAPPQPTMPAVIEEPIATVIPPTQKMTKAPALPTTTPSITIKPEPSTSQDTSPSLGPQTSTITIEEISSFISGPESSDGKWVCLFPSCHKRFGRKENIKSHVQTHLGDRQYRCEVCRKCFVRQHDLKRHAKIHTGIKPYPCLCGNSFARHDALTRHRQRGMCIGAFEGIVKKMAKRGRPRKRPLEDGEQAPRSKKSKPANPQSSESSSSGSSYGSESEMQTPREFFDFTTPIPETRSSSPYVKESSPDLQMGGGAGEDTPPTSPPDFGSFEEFIDHHQQKAFGFGVGLEEGVGKYEVYSSEEEGGGVRTGEGEEEEFLFSQDGVDILGLSALERDPGILAQLTT